MLFTNDTTNLCVILLFCDKLGTFTIKGTQKQWYKKNSLDILDQVKPR